MSLFYFSCKSCMIWLLVAFTLYCYSLTRSGFYLSVSCWGGSLGAVPPLSCGSCGWCWQHDERWPTRLASGKTRIAGLPNEVGCRNPATAAQIRPIARINGRHPTPCKPITRYGTIGNITDAGVIVFWPYLWQGQLAGCLRKLLVARQRGLASQRAPSVKPRSPSFHYRRPLTT